jgi:hypothetical protein
MKAIDEGIAARIPWNKGKLTGQKPPLKLREIWAIRIRLQLSARVRDLAMFNLAIDSKLRACDLTKLRVCDVCHGYAVASRTTIMQQKTQRPVQFEITEQTRDSIGTWIKAAMLTPRDFLFPFVSRRREYCDCERRRTFDGLGKSSGARFGYPASNRVDGSAS